MPQSRRKKPAMDGIVHIRIGSEPIEVLKELARMDVRTLAGYCRKVLEDHCKKELRE